MISKKIIINADDFGMSHEVNHAICNCFKKGIITNTTLMVNGVYADEAVELSKKYGFTDKVGLHFNITQGKSLTKKIRNYPFFYDSKKGEFNALFDQTTKKRLVISKEERLAIADEVSAQIEKFKNYGFKKIHFDSHHHVHTDLSIFFAIYPTLKRNRIKSIRKTRNINLDGVNCLKIIYKKMFNDVLEHMIGGGSDYFGDIHDYNMSQESLDNEKSFVIEIMVHPDIDKEQLINRGVSQKDEMDFEQWGQKIATFQKISYADLLN